MTETELGSITRELYIDAAPDVVFAVVSDPAHITQWWPDELTLDGSGPGADGEIVFGDRNAPDAHIELFRIVEAVPNETFSFTWCHSDGEYAGAALLVTFTLEPRGAGTSLTMTETGFREKGWEAAELEMQYREHQEGWAHYLPRLCAYALTVDPTGVSR